MLRTFFSRSLSRREHANTSSSVSAERFVGLERPSLLLQPAHRQQVLHQVAAITALPPEHYRSLVLAVIERYAGFVQRLPASEAHHHAGLGGMLDHGLEGSGVLRHGWPGRKPSRWRCWTHFGVMMSTGSNTVPPYRRGAGLTPSDGQRPRRSPRRVQWLRCISYRDPSATTHR